MGENSKIDRSNPLTGRPGPAPMNPRDGDKKQARQRINVEVRSGRRPNPNSLPCSDCGHIGVETRHEYDHYLGYAPEHHYSVQPVCAKCHRKRHNAITHCKRGHEYTQENTITRTNGTRQCRECVRMRDRGRRNAAYWRAYRKVRKDRSNEVPCDSNTGGCDE